MNNESSENIELEQRYAIKFCERLNKSATETLNLLQEAFTENALKKTAVFEWHKRFREGRSSLEDNNRAGRPKSAAADENINVVSVLIQDDPRITIGDIAALLGVSIRSAGLILTEQLGLRRVCCRWVPHRLTDLQLENRVSKCQQLLNRRFQEGLEFLQTIITGDECWVYFYDPETKQQSSVWKSPTALAPTKPKCTRAERKIMHIIVFDSEGIVFNHQVPSGSTVNALYYRKVLQDLLAIIKRKRLKYQNRPFKILHDNAPAHIAEIVQQYSEERNIEILPHPAYSPDLAP